MSKRGFGWIFVLLVWATTSACCHTIRVKGNRIYLDGRKGQILYKSSGDLDGDGRLETAFLAWTFDERFGGVVVARPDSHGWKVITTGGGNICEARADITDINGDGGQELVSRAMSGDGHMFCRISVLKRGQLETIGDFHDTRFVDLSSDGVPELLSTSCISFGFTGDHWLTIYKWNGKGYTDVSRRYPKAYDAVIRNLKRTIHRFRYTKDYGQRLSLTKDADVYADFYYYLGKAFEYRRQPENARIYYAIAYRLEPEDKEKAKAFRRVYHFSKSFSSGK